MRLGSLLGLVCGAVLAAAPAAAQTDAAMPMLELFTSQGCSSCPAADALLKSYAERKDMIALSLSIDRWDYLGWKDTLANPNFTKRWNKYAQVLPRGKDPPPYTPQAVINGREHVIGSHRDEIDHALESTAGALAKSWIPLKAWSEQGRIVVEAGQGADGVDRPHATLWLASVQPQVDVFVQAGENRGKHLSYYNVVRELTPVGMWSGKPLKVELPQGDLLRAGERCAVFVQDGASGPIIAAAWLAAGR